jgi:hypothetical protein
MHLWEMFEQDVLDQYGAGAVFTNRSLAADIGIEDWEASEWIQRYLGAQRRPRARTRYVLTREDRTKRAVWTVGLRAQDARQVIGQFGRDVSCTIRRAVKPDLDRIGAVNPRARTVVATQLEPLIDGVIGVIGAMIATVGWNGEEDA